MEREKQPELVTDRRSAGKESYYKKRRAAAVVLELLLAALILTLIFFVWLRPVRITGDSMEPALKDGQIVLCDRLGKFWKMPARGDMIAFTTDDGLFIKRIVALPGETVELENGRVFINSVPLDESAYAIPSIDSMARTVVPEGTVFVLGDNRKKIYDSRLAAVGCIPYKEITGVLRVRITPVSSFTIYF